MQNKKPALIWGALIVVVLGVLFAWPKFNDPNRTLVQVWEDADIDCLPSHQNALLHIHPILTITVDGAPERIPADTGIVRTCMAEVHTHDATGVLHVESVSATKEFTLDQFFTVWQKDLLREGYELRATVNDEAWSDPEALILEDGQEIVLEYLSIVDGEPVTGD
jgi:hypothetical protein